VPVNCLKIDTTRHSSSYGLVQRGRKLYDPEHSTFNIGQYKPSVTVRMVVALDFEDMPQSGRNYATARAARTFGAGRTVNPTIMRFLEGQEVIALVDLEEAEDEVDDTTLVETNGYFYRMHRRRRFV